MSLLHAPTPPAVTQVLDDATAALAGGPADALALAGRLQAVLPLPGSGGTTLLWQTLADLARLDLGLARAVEPHLDAHAILAEAVAAGVLDDPSPAPAGSTWGVFAAEGGTDPVRAHRGGGQWLLTGTKPWCSLAGDLSHALVTAWVDEHRRGLFAVDLSQPGVRPDTGPGRWVGRGLREVVSLPVALEDVVATPVGPPGWYLERDGFAWGGIGVAAVWFGGAVHLAERLTAPQRREPDQVALLHHGTVDVVLTAARAVLADAARAVDAGRLAGHAGAGEALRVRCVVHDGCERVVRALSHGLGPAPLVTEERTSKAVADLQVYLRQHHAERDEAALGRHLADHGTWW